MGLAWLFILFLGPAAAQEEAQPVRITTAVEPKQVQIGTPFRWTIKIDAEPNLELIIPVLGDRLGDLFVTDFGELPRREERGRALIERWYSLVAYEPGDLIVPGPTVQYRQPGTDLVSADAPDALVIVESLMTDAAEGADIRDIEGPVAVPRDYSVLWWAGFAVLALGLLVLALYRLLNRKRNARAAPLRPAHELALEGLARLHAARLPETGRYEEFYVRLSSVVRTYLEGRFHLRAPEMTTEEFLQAAQRDPQLAAAHRSSLGQFLSEADLVKFARYVPSTDDAERAYTAARQFVESTRPRTEVERAAA